MTNWRTQIVTKLKNLNCVKNYNHDETQIVMKLKTLILTKLKSSNCDKTQKHKLWQLKNSNCDKTQIVTNLKMWRRKKIKMWQKSYCDKLEKKHMTKLQNSNCEKKKLQTQVLTKLKIWQISSFQETKTLKGSFSKNILTPWQPMRCSLGSVLQFLGCIGKVLADIIKQACCAGCRRRPSPAEAPPIGKIHPFSKMTVTFEPPLEFWCPSGFRKFLITTGRPISSPLGVAAP